MTRQTGCGEFHAPLAEFVRGTVQLRIHFAWNHERCILFWGVGFIRACNAVYIKVPRYILVVLPYSRVLVSPQARCALARAAGLEILNSVGWASKVETTLHSGSKTLSWRGGSARNAQDGLYHLPDLLPCISFEIRYPAVGAALCFVYHPCFIHRVAFQPMPLGHPSLAAWLP